MVYQVHRRKNFFFILRLTIATIINNNEIPVELSAYAYLHLIAKEVSENLSGAKKKTELEKKHELKK